ncbi:hypothetical protein NEF87_000196 [Candidatus Lokiarchaeum ossiferum]|uniref:Ribbon-helix-helix protein CopG domain-containing protein n=1 Tax=Candidatus Lokiarchaeum ossiferum TaxID=2951803 RepID=A0ABY6HKG8_9ARCH|nr:hypothetical protein NEF87_000196 [Candidatus Lokiarchaeum sp. B-35]
MKKITLKLSEDLLENVRDVFKQHKPHRKADYFSDVVREVLYEFLENHGEENNGN